LYVSPAEQPPILKSLGRISSLPEKHGCDFLIPTKKKFVGIQRKRLDDFIASIHDGRLSKEVLQSKSSNLLTTFIMIIEEYPLWTNDGYLTLPHTSFKITSWYGMLMSLQLNGCFILQTTCVEQTAQVLKYLADYFSKEHRSLITRPKPASPWGKSSNRLYASHLLQSFPGIGAKTAENILHVLGVPLKWTVTEKQLSSVPGVGKLTAKRLLEVLDEKI
jgi:ERCC4-type nuclease